MSDIHIQSKSLLCDEKGDKEMDDFKKAFSEESQKLQQEQQKINESRERYKRTALGEFPRLSLELASLIKDIFEGVSAVQIRIENGNIPLVWDAGGQLQTFGNVEVPFIAVGFHGKHILFKPEGNNVMGVCGKIAVEVTGSCSCSN